MLELKSNHVRKADNKITQNTMKVKVSLLTHQRYEEPILRHE